MKKSLDKLRDMFDHKGFSRSLKIALSRYLAGESIDKEELTLWLNELKQFEPLTLKEDDKKKAFWINVYNGLTNYFIISHTLKETVWEVKDFFSVLKVKIGTEDFSLDDIEHGILRKNGERKKGKPLQFEEGNAKLKLMIDQFDPRIHFALNCGSISCPPVAFYSKENIDQELSLAEESFASQEFMINQTTQEIRCSEIFIWYRMDFQTTYLNAPDLKGLTVIPIPYQWTIH